ncbi:helix-turn-helix transcriptional regulator [Kitasatospora brasiliensis]|uniref:helix-turn-helix transcriptional regulator n=1 Tax=Kitasatospora brasiliensis TaxID=3058040 RepID=UPI00292E7267|nr:AAA family ATPase [Kitasatospora sp. K002]
MTGGTAATTAPAPGRQPAAGQDALVERDAETAALRAAVAGLRSGRPAVIAVEGLPGTGRSALLRYAAAAALDAGLAAACADGTPAETDRPFGIVSQLLARLGADDADDPADGPLPRSCRAFLTAARERPLLVAVDDVQWADPDSRRWLETLARRTRGAPLVLLVAGTPGSVPAALPGTAARLAPRPLSRAGTAGMLALHGDGPVEEAFAEAAHAACEGNPAVLRAVLDSLAADGLGPTAEAAACLPGRAAEAVGDRTARLVDGLGPELAALLRAIAVGGPHLGLPQLCELAALRTLPAPRALRLLAAAGLVTDPDHPSAPPGVADRVLAGLTVRQREDLCTRAAALGHRTALPDAALAELLLGARPGGAGWAADALTGAAARYRGTEPARAARLLERALAEPLAPQQRARLLVDLGAAVSTDAPDSGERALWSVLHDPKPDVPPAARLRAADLLAVWGHAATVRRGTAVAWSLPGAGPAERSAFQALYWLIGDGAAPAEGVDVPDVPPLCAPPDGPAQAGVLALRSALAQSLPLARVRTLAEAALRPDRGHPALFTARLAACYTLALTDAYEAAAAGLDDIVAEARSRGVGTTVTAALSLRAAVALRRGWLEEADRDLAEVEWAVLPSSAPVKAGPLLLAMRLLLHLERDEVDEAARCAAAELPVLAVNGLWWPMFLHARGLLGLRTGDHRAALSDLLECGRGLLARGWTNPAVVPWRSAAAVARLGRGDRAGAELLAKAEHAAAEAWGSASAVGTALLALGRVTEGEPAAEARAAAARLLRDATPPEWATPRRARRVRELTGGPAALRPSWDTTAEAAGGRGPEAGRTLTETERRVAELVRGGLTNAAVARRLSVSRRMVETHLTRAYRKLGASGRQDLARLIPQED